MRLRKITFLLSCLLIAALSFQTKLYAHAHHHDEGHSHGDDEHIKPRIKNFGATIDIFSYYNLLKKSPDSHQFFVREAEVWFSSQIEPWLDAYLSLAGHQEEGVSLIEVHEAYGETNQHLFGDTNFRIGKFLLGTGFLNGRHRHEWPFATSPLVQKSFFGDDALADSGLGVKGGGPLQSNRYFYSFGLTNSWTFGHAHSEGEQPLRPLMYLSLGVGLGAEEGNDSDVGKFSVSYIDRLRSDGALMQMIGVSLEIGSVDQLQRSFFVVAEYWLKNFSAKNQNTQTSWGAYVFPRVRFWRSLFLGLRLEHLEALEAREGILGQSSEGYSQRVSQVMCPQLSYIPSPNFHVNLGVDVKRYVDDEDSSQDATRSIYFQTVLSLN